MSGVASTSIVTSAKASPEQKKAIADLIQFLTDSDAQLMYPKYNIPVSSRIVTPDPATVDPLYTKLVELIKAHPLTAVYDGSMNSEQADIVNNGLQGIMLGAVKPADLAKQLQATVK
jgi:ABC-type glycerol-3-phosphate transport system substrate-binding protein